MDDKRPVTDRLGGLDGTDAAALGVDPPPHAAPPGAEVSDEEHLVPGAGNEPSAWDEESR
ncbi:MAG: hypothetical protein ACRDGD_00335 [Candidatus Limnocylindria bacterium]